MHSAIFSPKERLIIEEYLETGKKLESFRTIKHRIAKFKDDINDDHALMIRWLGEITED